MKKLAILLFAVSFSLLAFPGNVLASTLSLSPSSGTFNQGCNFPVDVVVDTQGIQSDGTDAILMYDSSRFTAQTITNGTVYPDFPGNNIDASSGKITISGLASVSTPFTGKGTLATINFKVSGTAPAGATQVTFDFDPNNKAKTIDSNVVERGTVADTLNSVVNGNYVIGTAACGATATSTSKPTFQQGTGGTSTPSGTTFIPVKTLPDGGTFQLTSAMAIFGGILTVLGILGLALL